MSSLAQEESRSISENCTWGQRKRFADGKVTVPFRQFLGYDRGPNGELVVNPEEAVTIKLIYKLFLQGTTYNGIAKRLTEEGYKTPAGKDKWNTSTVKSILSNEKYKGDALLQKSFTVDYLTKKTKNQRRRDSPVLRGRQSRSNHRARGVRDGSARNGTARQRQKNTTADSTPSQAASKCGQCGSWYGSKVWHSNSKIPQNHLAMQPQIRQQRARGTTPHLCDDDIKAAFLSAANKLLSSKKEVVKNGREMINLIFDTTALQKEHDELLDEAAVVADMVQQCIYENAHVALDQTEYKKKYDSLSERYDKLKSRLDETSEEISKLQSQKANVEAFLKAFEEMPDTLTEFSIESFNALVDFATVYSTDDIRFTFKNGQEIKA